jgi:hypothetical protein
MDETKDLERTAKMQKKRLRPARKSESEAKSRANSPPQDSSYLAGARDREPVDDWSQGVPLATLRSLIDYWRTDYDWRRGEAELNRFPQYRTEIDGLHIHFIHVRSPHADALPIILTHGWPSTVLLFRSVIGRLADPMPDGGRTSGAFHVVVPSLPRFGFSDKPAERGWNAERTASAWAALMERLGYQRYVAQGGDWGAYVTTAMAQQRPSGLAGIHLNLLLQVVPDKIPERLSPDEQRAVDALNQFRNDGSGYLLSRRRGRKPSAIHSWIRRPVSRLGSTSTTSAVRKITAASTMR